MKRLLKMILPAVAITVGMNRPEAEEQGRQSDRGGDRSYFGERAPGSNPERFAPGLFSTPGLKTSPVFSADAKEMFWTHGESSATGMNACIMSSRLENDRWTRPAPLPFCIPGSGIADSKPAVTPDGQLLIFASTRPIVGRPDVNAKTKPGCLNLWHSKRSQGRWGVPVPFSEDFNTSADEDCPSVDAEGNLYFISNRDGTYRSYVSSRSKGNYSAPEAISLPGLITCFSATGQFRIYQVPGRTARSRFDVFVEFKRDGRWRDAIEISPALRNHNGFGATASPDGKFLFFMGDRDGGVDVFWVKADLLGAARRIKRNSRWPAQEQRRRMADIALPVSLPYGPDFCRSQSISLRVQLMPVQ